MARITDVARQAGVSPATVSRVLNRPDLVTPEKRDRVLAAVKSLDYSPNALASGLRAGAVRTVALLVGDISQPFQGAFAKAISRHGEALGYRVLLCDLDHSEERLVRLLGEFRTSDISGVVLATADDLSTPPVLAAIAAAQARGLSVVSSSQEINASVPAIVPRYQAISHLATLHLATQGRWPIIFLGGSWKSPLSRERLGGYERACAELGYHDYADWTLDGNFGVDQSRNALEALFEQRTASGFGRPGAPFGVVAINMRMAIGALQAAEDRGLSVPGDMSLVCCEELQLAAEWRPAVSTVGIDFDAIAEASFASLIAADKAPPITYLPHRLIVRTSSARPGAEIVSAVA
jgi:DNA-binding LacI/PurR family transcriptional regulator